MITELKSPIFKVCIVASNISGKFIYIVIQDKGNKKIFETESLQALIEYFE